MATATPANPVPVAKPVDTRGLANQVIGETKVCAVTQTELIYRGFEIADLAEKATFEGVAHLVLVGHKPSDAELAAFDAKIDRTTIYLPPEEDKTAALTRPWGAIN